MFRSIREPQLELQLVFLLCIPVDGVAPLHLWDSAITLELSSSFSHDRGLQRAFLAESNNISIGKRLHVNQKLYKQ